MVFSMLSHFSGYIVLCVSSENSSTTARYVWANSGEVYYGNKTNYYVRAFLRVAQLWEEGLFRQCGTPPPYPIEIKQHD